MVPDSIVLTFDVRLPPTTDLAQWELMLLVANRLSVMRRMMRRMAMMPVLIMMATEHRAGLRMQATESLSHGCKR